LEDRKSMYEDNYFYKASTLIGKQHWRGKVLKSPYKHDQRGRGPEKIILSLSITVYMISMVYLEKRRTGQGWGGPYSAFLFTLNCLLYYLYMISMAIIYLETQRRGPRTRWRLYPSWGRPCSAWSRSPYSCKSCRELKPSILVVAPSSLQDFELKFKTTTFYTRY
jgi:hypothetical protein